MQPVPGRALYCREFSSKTRIATTLSNVRSCNPYSASQFIEENFPVKQGLKLPLSKIQKK